MIVRTIATSSASSSSPATKLRSIFSSSIGKTLEQTTAHEQPVPSLSNEDAHAHVLEAEQRARRGVDVASINSTVSVISMPSGDASMPRAAKASCDSVGECWDGGTGVVENVHGTPARFCGSHSTSGATVGSLR